VPWFEMVADRPETRSRLEEEEEKELEEALLAD
jgi:hypothetical protein